jgi:hypothetical protein
MLVNKDGIRNLARPEVIQELKGVIERNSKSSKLANLRTAVVNRTIPELGISSLEVALSFYSKECKESGLYYAYILARNLIARTRKKLFEMNRPKFSVRFYAAYVEVPGYKKRWLHYCMYHNDSNVEKIEQHLQSMIDGIKKRHERQKAILAMDPEERRRRTEEVFARYGYEQRYEYEKVDLKKLCEQNIDVDRSTTIEGSKNGTAVNADPSANNAAPP